MRLFDESLLKFEKLVELVLVNYRDDEKLRSVKDRLKCQLVSYKDLYDYVKDFQGSIHVLISDLIAKY